MIHELSKLTMIDSDASIHVCPLNNGQGDGFRKSSETRAFPGADMQSLRPMLDSGCDVYFAKDRCWTAKNNGKELDVILSSGVFFVAAKPSKLSSRKRSVLELNSMSQAEIERATSTSVQAGFGVPDPAARDTLDGDEPSVRIRIPTGPVTPSAEE